LLLRAGTSVASEPTVRWVDGTVSADFEGIPLDQAVAALSEQVGVVFRGDLRDARAIHARFERARFREVVDRLVGEQNFTITYDANGHPRRVELLSMPHQQRPTPPPAADFVAFVRRHDVVELPPVLATALGTPRGRLPRILRGGLRHRDPAVGSAAASLLVRQVESDPALRAAAMRMDDRDLTQLLRNWAGSGAARLAGAFAAQARDPLLRSKARRVRETLRRESARTAAAPAA